MTVFQPPSAVGLTHASMLMPVVRSSGVPAAPSITVTQSLTPLKDNAEPTLPGTRTAPVMVPLRALVDESIAVVPLASLNPRDSTSPSVAGGGGGGGGGGVGVGVGVDPPATLISSPISVAVS